MAFYPIIFKLLKITFKALCLVCLSGCIFTSRDNEEDILKGSIAYPFVGSPSLGKENPPEKFVVRSIVGQQDYVIEKINEFGVSRRS